MGSPESLRLDSLEAVRDSLAKDSLPVAPKKGIIMVNPEKNVTPEIVKKESSATSYVLIFLISLFCLTALRFRNNSRYIKVLFSELTEVRTRHNVFNTSVSCQKTRQYSSIPQYSDPYGRAVLDCRSG